MYPRSGQRRVLHRIHLSVPSSQRWMMYPVIVLPPFLSGVSQLSCTEFLFWSCETSECEANASLPMGSMILTGREAALGFPSPALFCAFTLKMYSLFSMTSLTMALSSSAFVICTGVHFTDVRSRSSMMKEVMGEPPSDSGGSQETVQPNFVTFPTMTFRGASGTLTKLVLGLYGFVGVHVGSAADPVSGADSEQIHGVLLESGHCVLRTLGVIRGQSPRLTLHVASLNNVGNDLSATIALRLLPRQTHLAVGGVDNLEVLHGSRDVWRNKRRVKLNSGAGRLTDDLQVDEGLPLPVLVLDGDLVAALVGLQRVLQPELCATQFVVHPVGLGLRVGAVRDGHDDGLPGVSDVALVCCLDLRHRCRRRRKQGTVFGVCCTSATVFGVCCTSGTVFGVCCTSGTVIGVCCTSGTVFGVCCTSGTVFGVCCTSATVFGVCCTSGTVFGVCCTSATVFGVCCTSGTVFGVCCTSETVFGVCCTSGTVFGVCCTSAIVFGASLTCELQLGLGVFVLDDESVLALVSGPDLADLQPVDLALAHHLVLVSLYNCHVVPQPLHLHAVLVQLHLEHYVRAGAWNASWGGLMISTGEPYLGPSLISRPFLYHLGSALSLVSLQVNSASSNSVMVWSFSCMLKSVGASLMISSAVHLLSPAMAVYSPSSASVQSLMVSVCFSLSARYTMRLLKVISWPAFIHFSVALGRFTLQEKTIVFFSWVSMSSRGTTNLMLSSETHKEHRQVM
ncbi:hypothetical protein F7725_002641 [Dissostichus mawsoni]|uniref:Uncharacterized protein n=1 Tax=Dissostichus mawsoni TaxID=36200 RepID=A0A7J5Y2Y5_DISMA|nr:hypothetical protein F7725_002641 [Dissostichus mawsoni]